MTAAGATPPGAGTPTSPTAGARSAAADSNATMFPSALIAGEPLPPWLGVPPGVTVTASVLPAARLRR